MTKEAPRTQNDDDSHYNYVHESDAPGTPEKRKVELIIPTDLAEFGVGASRAILHLIIEARHKITANSEELTEDM